MHSHTNNQIGFIGQGWIGKQYADDFERRGYTVVRYALEEPYVHNKDALKDCSIVFIAVPTPTTPDGFNVDVVRSVLSLLAPKTIAVVKSTIVPRTTEQLQTEFPDIIVLHSPEFLREATAAHDAAHPERNIVGVPYDEPRYTEAAQAVLAVLPSAPYAVVLPAIEAELVKYAGNCFLYSKVLFMNMLYDLVTSLDADYERVREALINDHRIGESHTTPVHVSGHEGEESTTTKRGAGGHCFIKDFEAFRQLYMQSHPADTAHELLSAMVAYNNDLLTASGKDVALLSEVYGDHTVTKNPTA